MTIPSTDLQDVYLTERSQVELRPHLEYTFSVPEDPGAIQSYRVTLHFAEIYIGALGPGLRVFSVFLQVRGCSRPV